MPLGAQIDVMNADGFARLRGGVVNSLVAGTIRILQGWQPTPINNYAVTFSAATVVDPVSGFNIIDFDVPVTRRFVLVRFIGAAPFVPGPADRFEMAAVLIPVAFG